MPSTRTLPFSNRTEAAERLALALSAHRGRHPLVMAIPRGAVPMARLVADRLGGTLDVVLVRKIGAPGNPEFAVASVDESGWLYVAPYALEAGANPGYLEREAARQLALIRRRRALYTPAGDPRTPAAATSSWSTTAWPPAPPCAPRSTPCASTTPPR